MKKIIVFILLGSLLLGFNLQSAAGSPKEIVAAFFTLAFVERQPVKAANKYISDKKYIQHNPFAADGREAFVNGFAKYILESSYKCELKRIISENDLVVTHSHCKAKPADRGSAVVDIFRVEKGKIVEHWDVEQAVPEKSENLNTMF